MTTTHTATPPCLNPYSTGSNSNNYEVAGDYSFVHVLILILLEVTQIIFWIISCLFLGYVLILILLEVTQIVR